MNKHLPLENSTCPLCNSSSDIEVAHGTDYEYKTTDQNFSFLKCDNCDVLYLNPRPAVSALSDIYPKNYYSFTGEDESKNLVKSLRKRWEIKKVRDYTRWLGSGQATVLDVGCGTGRLLSLIRESAPASWKLHGIELDPHAVTVARTKGFDVTHSTLENFNPHTKFDLIILQQVIEHVEDPLAMMRKLHHLLSIKGVVILETPNLAGWDYKLFRKGLWGGYHFPRHWTLFTKKSLRKLSINTGFEVIEHQSLMSLSFWSWSIHHLIYNKKHPKLAHFLRPPNSFLLAASLPLELLQLFFGLQTSNQRIILRKKANS